MTRREDIVISGLWVPGAKLSFKIVLTVADKKVDLPTRQALRHPLKS